MHGRGKKGRGLVPGMHYHFYGIYRKIVHIKHATEIEHRMMKYARPQLNIQIKCNSIILSQSYVSIDRRSMNLLPLHAL